MNLVPRVKGFKQYALALSLANKAGLRIKVSSNHLHHN